MGFFYAIGYAVGTMKREYQHGHTHATSIAAIREAEKAKTEFLTRVSELALTDKLAAIKLYRSTTNSSLREAVDFVKRVHGEPPIVD